jgi:protein SCO1/2
MNNGKEEKHTVGNWTYYNQDSIQVTSADLSNKVYVADFFFMSCPNICPKVMKEMTRIHEAFKDNANVHLVSFTLDPKRDSISKLKTYANNLGVKTDKWWFLHGDQDATIDLAMKKYFVSAEENAAVPGGFDHSGKIMLIDKNGHVRSYSEGTDPSTTPKLIDDINNLLQEK